MALIDGSVSKDLQLLHFRKISHITPIYKHGLCADPANYCPVAVFSTLSGVFEHVLLPQLQKHIHIFNTSQYNSQAVAVPILVSLLLDLLLLPLISKPKYMVALNIKDTFDCV